MAIRLELFAQDVCNVDMDCVVLSSQYSVETSCKRK